MYLYLLQQAQDPQRGEGLELARNTWDNTLGEGQHHGAAADRHHWVQLPKFRAFPGQCKSRAKLQSSPWAPEVVGYSSVLAIHSPRSQVPEPHAPQVLLECWTWCKWCFKGRSSCMRIWWKQLQQGLSRADIVKSNALVFKCALRPYWPHQVAATAFLQHCDNPKSFVVRPKQGCHYQIPK